jgi:methionine sulfoxide reductase heme-binding subunit
MVASRASGARSLPWYQAVRPSALYVVGLIPAVWTFYLGVTDQLGADPMKALENELGIWALRFLIAGLAVTPLRQLTGVSLLRYRRAIGLLAFIYVCLHLLTYMALDQGLDLAAIWADIVKRPFITVGMGAFLILVLLAVTSNNAVIRRLRPGVWQRLHRWVYVAAVAAVVHFVMVVKAWPPEPLVYAAIVTVLLGYRLVTRARPMPSRRPRASGGQPIRTTD